MAKDEIYTKDSGESYYNVLYVLKQLNDHGELDIMDTMEYLRRDERTIKRYINAINDVIGGGNKICKKKGNYYSAQTKKFLEFDPAVFTTFALIANMFDNNTRKFIFKNIDEKVQKAIKAERENLQKHYLFLTRPLEEINLKILDDLKIPLENRQRISLKYLGEKFIVEPYKIIFMDENFYLACVREGEFAMLRISNISDIKRFGESFNKKPPITRFIDNHIQTSWTDFNKFEAEEIDIKLRVKAHVARYFTDKKPFLRSQKIEQECENGDKIVNYRVTQFMEIKPFIKKWLPNIEIIDPIQLKDEILSELKEYIKSQEF